MVNLPAEPASKEANRVTRGSRSLRVSWCCSNRLKKSRIAARISGWPRESVPIVSNSSFGHSGPPLQLGRKKKLLTLFSLSTTRLLSPLRPSQKCRSSFHPCHPAGVLQITVLAAFVPSILSGTIAYSVAWAEKHVRQADRPIKSDFFSKQAFTTVASRAVAQFLTPKESTLL